MSALVFLQSILALLGTIKGLPGLAEEVISFLVVGEQAVAQAIAAHKSAMAKVDASLLTPEDPVK